MDSSVDTDDTLVLRRLARVLRRRRWVILQCLVIGAAAGVLIGVSSAERYSASASLLIASGGSAGSTSGGAPGQAFTVQTAVRIMRSRTVAGLAAAALSDGRSADELLSNSSAQADADSGFLIVSAKDPTPARAARTANVFAQQFLLELSTLRATTPLHTADAQIIDAAVAPSAAPHSLRPVRDGLLGGALGLLVGLTLSFALEAFDPRLRAVDEVGELIPAPQLVAVPASALRRRRRREAPVKSRPGEPFDHLRMALLTFNAERSLKRLLITSPQDRADGKTATAASLGVSLVRMGLRVCVVDADLRQPGLAREFGLEGNAPGLAELLAGAPVADVLQRFTIPDTIAPGGNGGGNGDHPHAQMELSIVTAGTPSVDPASLLGGDRAEELLQQLEQEHDVVVLDCPPILAVSDGLPLLKGASGAILVVHLGRTRRRAVTRATHVVAEAGGAVLGVVITGVSKADIAADGHGPWPSATRTTSARTV